MNSVYLDWAATAPPDQTILSAADATAVETFGNPSSLHALGTAARAKLEDARGRCAKALGTRPDRIVFTSGGSESNNIVLYSLLMNRLLAERTIAASAVYDSRDKPRIAISAIEHACVYEPAKLLERFGFAIDWIQPDPSGFVTADAVKKLLTRDTVLVAVMAVNNETGAIQPTAEIAQVLRDHSKGSGRAIRFHVDSVQAAGKLPFSPGEGVDTASISAHKIGGPRGTGLLYTAKPFETLYSGGGQESGMRPGTENLAGASALAAALEARTAALPESLPRAQGLMDRLIGGLAGIRHAAVIPADRKPGDTRYSPWILQAAVPGIPGEALVRSLSDSGFSVSTGAACSSRKGGKRRVLDAMGIDAATAASSIRVSTGWTTTEADIDGFVDALAGIVSKFL
jgi:cysteine desulfurase